MKIIYDPEADVVMLAFHYAPPADAIEALSAMAMMESQSAWNF